MNKNKDKKINRAVILAGGLGTRLRPYTITIPKPLVPVGDLPILEIIIRQLVHNGFDYITIAVNHQAEYIRAFFGDGSKWNIKIDYSLEDKPLSTMGPLTLINDLPENFLVMNGDILTDLKFRDLVKYHKDKDNIFTISSHLRDERIDYGVLEVNDKDYLCGFKEKPTMAYHVSMGIYMVNKKVLEFIPPNTFYGFDDLMQDLMKNNLPAGVRVHDGRWLDIGRPEDYALAVEQFEGRRDEFLP